MPISKVSAKLDQQCVLMSCMITSFEGMDLFRDNTQLIADGYKPIIQVRLRLDQTLIQNIIMLQTLGIYTDTDMKVLQLSKLLTCLLLTEPL